jgi:hypothetical protein
MRKRTTRPVLERLDVDVARAFLDRFGQQRVDQADDRRIVFGLRPGLRAPATRRPSVLRSRSSSKSATIARASSALLVERAQQAFETGHARDASTAAARRGSGATRPASRAHAVAIGDFSDVAVPGDQRRAIAPGKAEAGAGGMLRSHSCSRLLDEKETFHTKMKKERQTEKSAHYQPSFPRKRESILIFDQSRSDGFRFRGMTTCFFADFFPAAFAPSRLVVII